MSTQEQQNDPYAELKQAWEAGRRKSIDDAGFRWDFEPALYEIEPLPADKWAAEKAAHAQGKRVLHRFMENGEWSSWMHCPSPVWCVANDEYRIAPDPTPAGKMSDKELGEIGIAALDKECNGHRWHISTDDMDVFNPIEVIARAVREQVEKQCEAKIMGFDPLACREEIARLNTEYTNMAMAEHGSCEELDKCRSELASLQRSYEGERNCSAERMTQILNLQREVEKANAELERLRWRPVSVKPTREDGDSDGNITATNGHHMWQQAWDVEAGSGRKAWRPFCPPPAPTAEEVERERFEKWALRPLTGQVWDTRMAKEASWVIWQAARTAFAAAVREQVEKGRKESMMDKKVLASLAKQAEEIDRLTAELEIFKKIRDGRIELQAKYDDLQVTMDSVTMNANWSIERMKEAEHKLATLEARLGEIAALPEKWRARPAVMSWNPAIDCIFELEAFLLPEPTAEAVSKADFERFARGEGYSLAKDAKGEFRDTAAIHGWKLWQAARAAKEGEK